MDYFDAYHHGYAVSLVRVAGVASLVAVAVGVIAGYGWPWNPSRDSLIGEDWAAIKIIWIVWALTELVYLLVQKRRRPKF